jgi:hypothetical protein
MKQKYNAVLIHIVLTVFTEQILAIQNILEKLNGTLQ